MVGRTVFLSIKPQHAEAILDGSKKYEYRRQPPVADPPYTMLLYATEDVQAVVGAALVDHVVTDNTVAVITRTSDMTPHDPDDLSEYFAGKDEANALHVRHAVRVEPPICRGEIGERWADFTVPQNFRYVTPEEQPGLVELTRTRLNTNHDR